LSVRVRENKGKGGIRGEERVRHHPCRYVISVPPSTMSPISHVGLSCSREFWIDRSCAETTLRTSILIRLNSSKQPLKRKREKRGNRRKR
jgi:hypothetical protein